MAPDDHDNQSGHGQPQPAQSDRPAPLLPNARATIYLDGLIYAAYNENKKVLESAICTQAENHQLQIKVKLRGQQEPIWGNLSEWDPSHTAVAAGAPFWLYVDSGNEIKEDEFDAKVHKGDRSFDSVFDFEGHHGKPLPLKAGTFAVFNFPNGTSYSAETSEAKLKRIPPNGSVATAEEQGEIEVSNLAGIDITAASNGAQKKSIVLRNRYNVYFSFELDPKKQYEISIENRPVNADPDPEHHFLQFYELFDVDRRTIPRFMVVDPEHTHTPTPEPTPEGEELLVQPPSPDNPPCAPGRGSGTGGLSGGG
jgi:hypothetical protein